MNWQSLVEVLQAKGFSKRRARRAVTAFFQAAAASLVKGETIEVPDLMTISKIKSRQKKTVVFQTRNGVRNRPAINRLRRQPWIVVSTPLKYFIEKDGR